MNTCIYYNNDRSQLSSDQRASFLIINSVLSVIIIVVNSMLIIAIKSTRQLSVQSIHLTYVMSVVDILHAVFGLTASSIRTYFQESLSCPVMLTLNFIASFFTVAPSTIIVLVTLDRYFHIRYLIDYSTVFTARRYNFSLGIQWISFFCKRFSHYFFAFIL